MVAVPIFRRGAAHESLGVDFSGNNLTLALVRQALNKREVTSLYSRNIANLSNDDVAKALKEVMSALKLKPLRVITIIPPSLAITKNIEIPSTDPREIKEIISLQAGRHTPYSREEIIIDYIETGTFKNNYTKILLVIVARNIVKRQYEILEKCGLKLERVFFAPEALAWAASRMLKIETDTVASAIANIDDGSTDFIVVFRKKPVFVRSISIGLNNLLREGPVSQAGFAEELKKSLEAYHNENIGGIPNKLYLTGCADQARQIEGALSESLGLAVMFAPYFNHLNMGPEAFKAASGLKQVSFLNLVAPLLGYDELKVDLVPDEIKLRKAIEERGRDLIKTGISALSIFVLIFFILLGNIFFKNAYLKKLNARYQPLRLEAEVLEKDYSKVTMIRHYLENRGFCLEVLTELYGIAPLELELNDIRQDEQGKFSIRGTAESMSTVFSFVDNMEKSRYFRDVKTKYTTKRRDGTKEVTDFEINSMLEKENG